MNVYTLKFDGSCWPNPGGTAKYGFVLHKYSEELEHGNGLIGTGACMSNNVAEYVAMCKGLQAFLRHYEGDTAILQVKGDSQLVINQMNRIWGAKRDKLYYEAYTEAVKLVKQARNNSKVTIHFDWIPREQNTECDVLSKL